MSESDEEDEILIHWALRFDGWLYCRESDWQEDDRLQATALLVDRLQLPADHMQLLTLFFMLQRFLYKWGGETLSRRSPEWRAFRTMFLITALYEIDPRYRNGERYENWHRMFGPRTAESISLVAQMHTLGYPPSMNDTDKVNVQNALQWYDLERYLFDTVGPRFHRDQALDAFDFFSIVIWKANRAKSHIARRLTNLHAPKLLPEIIADLTRALAAALDDHDRMLLLFADYGFHLPMASAILTVLWPERFTVYDFRACEQIGGFQKLASCDKFSDQLWQGYLDFKAAIEQAISTELSLRDKDRVLWARSGMRQLQRDIECQFRKEPFKHEEAHNGDSSPKT